jgi:hypothetical protein
MDDIAIGHLLAMEKGKFGESYIIAVETPTLVEAFHLAREITGIPEPMKLPARMVKGMSKIINIIEKVIQIPESYAAIGLCVISGVLI